MASGPHGARAALTGSIPVRIDTADTVRTRANDERFGRMVGKSPAMQQVMVQALVGKDGKVAHAEYVKDITQEPNYVAALAAAKKAAG